MEKKIKSVIQPGTILNGITSIDIKSKPIFLTVKDDFEIAEEKSSWNPRLFGNFDYSITKGYWQKIGNVAMVAAYIEWIKGDDMGDFVLKNLPFPLKRHNSKLKAMGVPVVFCLEKDLSEFLLEGIRFIFVKEETGTFCFYAKTDVAYKRINFDFTDQCHLDAFNCVSAYMDFHKRFGKTILGTSHHLINWIYHVLKDPVNTVEFSNCGMLVPSTVFSPIGENFGFKENYYSFMALNESELILMNDKEILQNFYLAEKGVINLAIYYYI